MGRALSLGQGGQGEAGETQRFGSPEPPLLSLERGRESESHLPTGVEDLTI